MTAIISLESREYEKYENKKEHVKPDQVVRLGSGPIEAQAVSRC